LEKLTTDQQRLVEQAMPDVPGILAIPCMAVYVDKLGREEATGIAHLALCVAATKWESDRGTTFKTYATFWVRSHLVKAAGYAGVVRDGNVRVGGRPGPRKTILEIQERDASDEGHEKLCGDKDLLKVLASRLKPRHRKVLFMYAQGYNFKEIAAAFLVSKQRAEQLYFDARELAQKALARRGLLAEGDRPHDESNDRRAA
jgi:RNA polymerase sigma factor (sigma-70 family)